MRVDCYLHADSRLGWDNGISRGKQSTIPWETPKMARKAMRGKPRIEWATEFEAVCSADILLMM